MAFRALALYALVVCRVAADDAGCGPRTPGDLVAVIRSGTYDAANRPGIARAGTDQAPRDVVRMFYAMNYLLGVDQRAQRMDVSGTFTANWNDWRLAFNASCAGSSTMYLPVAVLPDIWSPRASVANEVLTDVPQEELSLAVKSNGEVTMTVERRVVVKCTFNFRKMPYDIQRCPITFKLTDDPAGVLLRANTDQDSSLPPGNPEWNLKNIIREPATDSRQEESLEVKLRRRATYYRKYIIIPVILFVLVSYSSFYISRAAAPARVGATVVAFLVIMNFNANVLNQIPKVDYDVRLLTFLYLSMWFCAFAVFEYGLVNMLFRIEARVDKARDKAEAEAGITKMEDKREMKQQIKKSTRSSPMGAMLRKKGRSEDAVAPAPPAESPAVDEEAAAPPARVVDDKQVQEKIAGEIRRAAGRLGRFTLWGSEMWVKDQHIDIICRWLYLPLYIILSSLSLNFSDK